MRRQRAGTHVLLFPARFISLTDRFSLSHSPSLGFHRNFFRLENEHLGNVEKEKVVNIVPLSTKLTASAAASAAQAQAQRTAQAAAAAAASWTSSSSDFEPPKQHDLAPSPSPSPSPSPHGDGGIRIDHANRRKTMCPTCFTRCAERCMRLCTRRRATQRIDTQHE